MDVIERLWLRRNIVWLQGVRRVGKTVLCQSIDSVEYFDCELPQKRMELEDPEAFLRKVRGKRVVLDEIHKLANPSELLKIAADHFSETKVIATGSSTLQASSKFRDTLTGRKFSLWLLPILNTELSEFGDYGLDHRLVNGGLPPFFLANGDIEEEMRDWFDSFWARDLLELFRLEKRDGFQKLTVLLFINSGGIFEASRYSGPCEINRQTVTNYLRVLESTLVAQIVRPYSSRSSTEIVSAPKVYMFDTGLVNYYRGEKSLTTENRGPLWEHYVLNELNALLQGRQVCYWRDKHGHEVDFVITQRGGPPTAIESKWSNRSFDAKSLKSFRNRYPDGENIVVTTDTEASFERRISGLSVKFTNLAGLVEQVSKLRT